VEADRGCEAERGGSCAGAERRGHHRRTPFHMVEAGRLRADGGDAGINGGAGVRLLFCDGVMLRRHGSTAYISPVSDHQPNVDALCISAVPAIVFVPAVGFHHSR